MLGGAPRFAAASDVDLSLRFRLICDTPLEFRGEIVAAEGHFAPPENLSMEAGTTGGFWLRPDRQSIRIRPRGAADRLGLESRFTGPADEILTMRLRMHDPAAPPAPGSATEQTIEVQLPVADLVAGSIDRVIAGGVRLWVARAPGDSLRVRLGNAQALVFSAAETVPLSVTVNAPATAGGKPLELQMELRRDGKNPRTLSWQRTVPVDSAATETLRSHGAVEVDGGSIAMPDREGVYTLVTRLVPRSGSSFVERLTRPELFVASPIAQRSVQFVVLEPLPPPVDPTPLAAIAQLRPLDRSWLGVGSINAASGRPLGRDTYDGRTVAVLAGGDWLAQPIPISGIGKPHVVVVRYPADQPLKIGVSIRQPNTAGDSSPLGVDSGVVHEPGDADFHFSGEGAANSGAITHRVSTKTAAAASNSPEQGTGPANSKARWGEHRIVFWPRYDQPMVVVTNADPHQSVRIESITVEAGPERLAGGSTGPSGPSGGRMAAIYLDKPLITDAFGCEKAVDSEADVVLQDWTTFLQAGQRLVDYVQASGGNAAVLTAIGEGGSLYPSEVFAATPRYDTGTFFSDGRDPVRKDVLELLLRLFHRSGLRLVVGVELATPLPSLEAALEDPTTAVGLQWTDAVGRQYVERRPPRHGLAPYYNVLDPRTQEQISSLVQEIRTRYEHHPALAGIGLHLGPQTYVQLPAAIWGRDPQTLARLRSDWAPGDTPSPLPQEGEIQAWLDGEGAPWFSAWRQRQLGEFFARVANQTAGRPLLLLTADFLPPTSGDTGEAFGLDWRALAAHPGIVPMRLIREQLLVEPAHRMDDAKMNEDTNWDALLSEAAGSRVADGGPAAAQQQVPAGGGTAGGLVFRPPTEQFVELPASIMPWERGGHPVRLFTQAVPGGAAYRLRLARLLDGFDPQIIAVGGWTPSLGQESLGRSFLATFAELPRGEFRPVVPDDAASQVVRVRQFRDSSGLYVYAVNTAPWAMRMRIATDAAAGTPVRTLGAAPQSWTIGSRFGGVGTGAALAGVSTTWAGELAAGELIALHVAGPSRGVASWSGVPAAANRVSEQLAVQVEDLSARVAILGRPRTYGSLTNGGFEAGTEERIEGWLRAQHPPGCIRFTENAADGRRAIVLRNDQRGGSRTWLLSDSLDTPQTGRIALSLRARSLGGPARVRIALEGRVRETALRRSIEWELPAGGEWTDEPVWLKVPDLPSSDVEELRVAIDLISPGEIAIDDVRLYDFYLTDRERSELQRQTFVAVERMRRGDFTAAARLLHSHWAKYLRWLQMPLAVAVHSGADGGESGKAGVSPAASPTKEPAPGVANRLREWLPSPLRF